MDINNKKKDEALRNIIDQVDAAIGPDPQIQQQLVNHDRIAAATQKPATAHPAGSHPVGAFLDRLFAHDRPTLDTGQEGFASSVGATMGDMLRENAFKLRSSQSSPVSVLADPTFQDKMSGLDKTLSAQDQQASVAPVSGLSMALGGVKNRTFENMQLKNAVIKQSLLPAVETKYIGQDMVTGEMLEAKDAGQLKAYYITKYPGVFGYEDPELDQAVKKAFPAEEKSQKKSGGIFPSKKTKLRDPRAVEIFLANEPDKEAAMEYLNNLGE